MAAFASDRRSGWVRVLVLILCALFIFATIASPPAYAVGETVAVFGLAAVLSAATAALGFKLANNAEGQATLQNMVQDFTGASIAAGLVLTGSKVNGLINGMQYIKMAVHNGKTYLDERIFAWCQKWLAENGVYNQGVFSQPLFSGSSSFNHIFNNSDFYTGVTIGSILSMYNISVPDSWSHDFLNYVLPSGYFLNFQYSSSGVLQELFYGLVNTSATSVFSVTTGGSDVWPDSGVFIGTVYVSLSTSFLISRYYKDGTFGWGSQYTAAAPNGARYTASTLVGTNIGNISDSNDTGLSGTDTLGKDVIDLTLDQILEKLKEWAQDWYDAGADSVTNAATGAKDLPLSVTTGAATLNPDVADDGPLVWFPAFGWSLPKLRSGETDTETVDQGKENASAAETSTVDVAENQTVINSLVSWALNYIDPDTGLFSKFPLCVPYDAYLLVTSSLGVDAVGSDSIFGASPGDLDGVVTESIDTYSDFQPIININNDFELDGKTYPISISIDLTPWQPLVTFFREGMALLLIAELIGSEYKRIRGH